MIHRFPKIDRRTYETVSTLGAFRLYANEIERLVSDAAHIEQSLRGPKWRPATEDEAAEHRMETEMVRHLHDRVIIPSFRYSLVVSLWAILEREMKRFGENLEKESPPSIVTYRDFRGGLVEQMDKYVLVVRGFSMRKLPCYGRIKLLQIVRNCVVHCYGEPALSRDKDDLLSASSEQAGLFAVDGMPLTIERVFVDRSHQSAEDLFRSMFHRVGWRVDEGD